MNTHESIQRWKANASRLANEFGIVFPDAMGYATPAMKQDYRIAMDAQAGLNTAANAGVPAMLTTWIDPEVVNVMFAPTKATEILPETKKGDWLTTQAMFPVVEGTGEVSSYGDFNEDGSSSLNMNWPNRQSYHWQIMVRYGDRETEMAGLARINYVASLQKAAADWLKRYGNFTYFYGVAGLQNYGILNDPSLPASITPGTKAAGNGNVWMYNGAPNATANEVLADVQALFYQLATQTQGLIEEDAKMTLALGPGPAVALANTNSFGKVARELIKQVYPNLRIVQAPQYSAKSSTNPEGVAGGNFAQLIADEVGGEATGQTAFTEKLRAHRLIPATSSFKQKYSQGAWGAIIKKPIAFASMLGI